MEGSGGSVGRIMAAILGAPAEGERLARLGVAFQLTNFLRDVREDYGLDRIYLPADERERLGVGDDDLGRRNGDARPTRAGRGRSAARASALRRDRTRCSAPRSRPPARGIRLARAVYSAVLDRIERNGFDVLGARRGRACGIVARVLVVRDEPRPGESLAASGRTCSSAAPASPA